MNAELPEQIKMPGTTSHGDRAYNGDKYYQLCINAGMDTHGTVKRRRGLPWNYGDVRIRLSGQQRMISEIGPKTAFGASKKLGAKTLNLVLYRSGTGRNCMLSSTLPGMSASHWNLIPMDTRAFREFVALSASEMDETPTFPAVAVDDAGCKELTAQGHPGWFLLRWGRFTSTSSLSTLSRMKEDELLLEQIRLITEDIGIELASSEEDNPTEALIYYKDMTLEELLRKPSKDLKEIVKAYGYPKLATMQKKSLPGL
ncbi:MAG: hypothetical protein ACRDL7_07645 [Gaiellaceae bacterium]